ncbi:hypothetical protein [Oceanirhabdus sp. W0125-5]|uniref:hypothetical protein n=1 Tax=Oceanirhabdus sp. W0125-5 TaxID=2999116 RepID=UPI0022F2A688|nr:hypothetical protein [Oceanirhabdus sp. W0125-5]WBW98496.1 hypothetical protein OW730_06925 [Oceanirhabdus sp. W0125-5]
MKKFIVILIIIVIESNLIFCNSKFNEFEDRISECISSEYEYGIEMKFKFQDFHTTEKYFKELEKKDYERKEIKHRKIDNKSFINVNSLDLKIYIVLDSENKEGKIKMISSDKVMIKELLEELDSESFLVIMNLTTNIKYKLNNELENVYSKIIEYYNAKNYMIDEVDFGRGKEVIVYHKLFSLPLMKRKVSHIILVKYARENFLIVGDKEIIMDY